MNGLPLQALVILLLIFSANAAPYSKYGRTCKDIGCLPREVCAMAYESCSFNQQENVSCGRYPTCKKNTDGQSTQQNSGPSFPPSPTSNPNTNIWNVPATVKYTTARTTTTTTTTRRPWTTRPPYYNPADPSYNGGGSYYGNRFGDDTFGGSSFTQRPSYTTKRPSSSGSFGSFFSGLSNVLSGDLGKFLDSALSGGSSTGTRGGSSGGSGFGGSSFGSRSGSSGGGSFGSLFGSDTRPLTENKNYRGGLFSENTGSSSGSTGARESYGGYPVTRYGDAAASAPPANPTSSHGNYGWKLS